MGTKRWNRRVQQGGYNLITKYECEWTDKVASDPIIREHTASFALSDPITSRSALTETICLHAYGDDRSPIRYIDVVSLVLNKLYIYIIT